MTRLHKYKAIIFDLDDTLLNTSEYILPQAELESCQAMINAGLKADLQSLLSLRKKLHFEKPEVPVIPLMVEKLEVPDELASKVIAAGNTAFYHREIKEPLVLYNGAQDLLEELCQDVKLFLVTAGDKKTQMQKVEGLYLEEYFEKIYVVDPLKAGQKFYSFSEIQDAYDLMSDKILSVGNRISSDLSPAKRLNWRTCWIKQGEYNSVGELSKDVDFTFNSIDQLLDFC